MKVNRAGEEWKRLYDEQIENQRGRKEKSEAESGTEFRRPCHERIEALRADRAVLEAEFGSRDLSPERRAEDWVNRQIKAFSDELKRSG